MLVKELLGILFPEGTVGNEKSIDNCPSWPPDLFAAAATLLDASGCYTHTTDLMCDKAVHEAYLQRVQELCKEWHRDTQQVPKGLQELWTGILDSLGEVSVGDIQYGEPVRDLFTLFAVADEASKGIGWGAKESSNGFVALFLFAVASDSEKEAYGSTTDFSVPQYPHSICVQVPHNRAVVLPKSMAAGVGCTIRSQSHNLALLPPIATVKGEWRLAGKESEVDVVADPYLRLLLIPFPYNVPVDSVKPANHGDPDCVRPPEYFDLEQQWLNLPGDGKVTGKMLFEELVLPMLEAERAAKAGPTHGIVMPECALSHEVEAELLENLAGVAETYGLEFFIAGVFEPKTGSGRTADGRLPRAKNIARTVSFGAYGEEGETNGMPVTHTKHHRWCLDETQISRYNFQRLHSQDKSTVWWENIDVSQRRLPFLALRPDFCLSVLICEDLARSDPALPVIRAIGPNLVVALLMDGPQLPVRWPGRYAMSLADDPGSSVLSITCAGSVDSSNRSERNPVRAIGLWRHGGPNARTQEIYLPHGSHGIVLTLKLDSEEQWTLDHRPDGSRTTRLTFFSTRDVALSQPPVWL